MRTIRTAGYGVVAVAAAGSLWLLAERNYLAYHVGVEVFGAVVAIAIFTIAWHARRFAAGDMFLALGLGYLCVGVLDVLHALAYKGMGVFPGRGADPATQLWIAARYVESLTLLAAALLIGSRRRLPARAALAGVLGLTVVLVGAILGFGAFPACFREGKGLTTFKVASEYVICAVLLGASVVFWRRRKGLSPRTLHLLLASIGLTILSELSFTLYADVYGFFNFLGHVFKLFSLLFVYGALVRGSLETPYESLFQGLARSEEALKAELAKRQRLEKERRRMEARVREAERFEGLATLAGGVAHDLNNILTAILGHAALAREEAPDGSKARDRLEGVIEASRRAAGLAQRMLACSGQGRLANETIELGRFLRKMKTEIAATVPEGATLHFDLAEGGGTFQGDPSQVRLLVMSLVENAAEALEDGRGAITIRAGETRLGRDRLARMVRGEELPAGRYAFLEVEDTGCGMDAPTTGRVFDPFFSTKFTGRGLGLAAALGILRAHGGATEVWSEPGEGTRLTAFFPAPEPADAETPPSDGPDSGTVLVIDDETVIRRLCLRVLERSGFTVLGARDGREGVRLFREHGDEVVLALVDMMLPFMDGQATLAELRRINPRLKAVLTSGFDPDVVAETLRGGEPAGFLPKPFTPGQLLAKVREALSED